LPVLVVSPRDPHLGEVLDVAKRPNWVQQVVLSVIDVGDPCRLIAPDLDDRAARVDDQGRLVARMDEYLVGLAERPKSPKQILCNGYVASVEHEALHCRIVETVGRDDLQEPPVS